MTKSTTCYDKTIQQTSTTNIILIGQRLYAFPLLSGTIDKLNAKIYLNSAKQGRKGKTGMQKREQTTQIIKL